MTSPSRLPVLALLLCLAAPACKKDQPPPPVPVMPAEPAAGAAAAGAGGDLPPPPHPSGAAALKWTLPKGWSEEPAGGMRFATLKPPGTGKVDVSVVVLPGTAGGSLANVNRWRGQIGLGPVDGAGLAAARKLLETRAGKVELYDFSAGQQARTRMVAGLLETADGSTWFLKMVGDEAPVAASRAGFLAFLGSLHF